MFHLLENARSDFNQTWQESSLGVGDLKLYSDSNFFLQMVHMAPHGGPGGGGGGVPRAKTM